MTESQTPMPGLLHDERLLNRISDELAAKFEGIFAAETIERYVFESYTALARTAKVRAHLPVITIPNGSSPARALRARPGACAVSGIHAC